METYKPTLMECMQDHMLTALHEAGHAVTLELLGFRVKLIHNATCAVDRRTTARVRRIPQSTEDKSRQADYGVHCVAGIAAEAIEMGSAITDELRQGSGEDDYKHAGYLAIFQPSGPPEATLRKWEQRATSLLRDNWLWVQIVASEWLDNECKLTGDEILALRPATENHS